MFPDDLEAFVDLVVPELQRRGLFRKRYEGRTLRDRLLEAEDRSETVVLSTAEGQIHRRCRPLRGTGCASAAYAASRANTPTGGCTQRKTGTRAGRTGCGNGDL